MSDDLHPLELDIRRYLDGVGEELPIENRQLSPAEAILELLHEHGELYGLRIVELSQGKVARGTVYTYLSRFELQGLVTARDEPKPASVRWYKITAEGEKARRNWHLYALLGRLGRV